MKKPQLLVRDVDPRLVIELKKRAVANNRSAEAEHREILEDALRGTHRVPLSEALMKIQPTVTTAILSASMTTVQPMYLIVTNIISELERQSRRWWCHRVT